jgi:hypothetical protein
MYVSAIEIHGGGRGSGLLARSPSNSRPAAEQRRQAGRVGGPPKFCVWQVLAPPPSPGRATEAKLRKRSEMACCCIHAALLSRDRQGPHTGRTLLPVPSLCRDGHGARLGPGAPLYVLLIAYALLNARMTIASRAIRVLQLTGTSTY